MPDWYEAKKEILVSLYRYQMLTPRQLAILLGYKPNSIYRVGKSLQKQGVIHSVLLSFLGGNSRGYVLTENGAKAAAYLYGEADTHSPRLWKDVPSQLEHLFGTNQFFIDLITFSMGRPMEGLVEWLGTRDAADRYAKFEASGKKKLPLKPDGLGTYRLGDGGRLVIHLEYDTGAENLWRIQDKLWNYGMILSEVWEQVERINVLILTKGQVRVNHIIQLWNSLRAGPLAGYRLPMVWCTSEIHYEENGMNASWYGAGNRVITLERMGMLPPQAQGNEVFLGKQDRPNPFNK